MKRIILLILLTLSTCHIHAQSNQQEVIDSLLRVAYSMPHDTVRLNLLRNITISEQYTPQFITRADELLKEATFQQSQTHMCDAAYYHALYYYNYTEEHDSIAKWVAYIAPIAEEIGYWSCYFNAQKLLINSFIYSENYEFALNESQIMQKKAKQTNSINGLASSYLCMANAYSETNRIKRKEEAIIAAYKLMPDIQLLDLKMDIYEQLVEHYGDIYEYHTLGKYLNEYNNLLTEVTQGSLTLRNAYPSHFFYINTYYIYYYTGIEEFDKARNQIAKTRAEYTDNVYKPYGILLHDACAKYHLALNQYQSAINHTDSALDIEQTYGVSCRIHIELLRLKADILTSQGEYNKALPIYEHSKQLRDSLNRVISEKQFSQIKEIYEFDKLQQEEFKLQRLVRTILLIIILIMLIVCSWYMYRVRKINKQLRESEKATKEATEKTEKANEEKSHFLSNMSHAIRVPLNSVVGFSQLLVSDETFSEEERSEFASITQMESNKLMRLVNNVLDLSRLEAKMMKWNLSDVDIAQLCNDAVNSARMQTDKARILYESEIPETIIHTDSSRLLQLISTLLYNPFCQDKEVRVIYLYLQAKKDFVEITVVNSPLSDPIHASEEVDMHHQINKLMINYFQGEYTILPNTSAGATIQFTLPISKK